MNPDIYRPGQDHYFGGGATESVLSPIVLAGMIVAILLIFGLPKKRVIAPALVALFLIPMGQEIYAVGVHWLVCRIIILACLARAIADKKDGFLAGGFNSVDKAFAISTVCQTVAFLVLYGGGGAVNQFGFLIDELGAYLAIRAFVRDEECAYRAFKCLAVVSVILAGTMVREQMTVQNIFGQLGGVPLVPEIREHKIRSQGSFSHSLTAGTFAATLVPLFILLWSNGKAKVAAAAGMIGCTVMMICSNSSTPLLGYAAGLFGIGLWPIRDHMRVVRRLLAVSLVFLHMVMKAPVWFLLARIDLTGSSSGYHRAELVDQCIRHFWDWWLIGTKDAGTWAYDLWDAQNQYVKVAENGGIVALVYMIVMIKRQYANLGNARKLLPDSKRQQWALWMLGSALFAHLTSFFGINYFDQARDNWFLLFAAIVAFSNPVLQGALKQEPPLTEASQDSASEWFQENGEDDRIGAPASPISV